MTTFGSLFSGIGGFDLGFERAGMVPAYQAERDKDCNRVLSNRFPHVERYDDVTTANNLPTVDVLCGGFPCQDLSVAGKRKGLAGERSGLWFEFLRIVASTHPQFVVIENVPGLLSSNRGRDFAKILQGLVQCGYGVAWRVLDAQYDHLAQRRERVFIVGSLGNGRAAEILFEPEGVCGDSPPSRQAWQGTTDDVTGNTGNDSAGDTNKVAAPGVPDVAWALQERDAKGPDSSTKDGHLIVGALASHTRQHGHAMTSQQAAESGQLIAHTLRAEADASEDGTGRGTPIVVAATLNGGGNSGGFRSEPGEHLAATAYGVRRLTPTECERLQGFPDGWTATDATGKAISDSARYRMLGNAVAVPVAKWIGKRIIAMEQQQEVTNGNRPHCDPGPETENNIA